MARDGIGIHIQSAAELLAGDEERANDKLDLEDKGELFKESLHSFITTQYNINRDARRDSGIEAEILESLRAFNGEYSAKDKERINRHENGSAIWMNITATKSRACKSWMADIFTPANEEAFWIEPSPLEDLPADETKTIEDAIAKEFQGQIKEASNQPPTAQQAQDSIIDLNQKRRDIKDAILNEISKEAKHGVKLMERQIIDQLAEGGWHKALLEFLDDFSVYPTAFMKGPVISKKDKLTWKEGKAVVAKQFVFENCSVSPLDMYPSPASKGINDGNLCEHVRFTKKAIYDLIGVEGYSTEKIQLVLNDLAGATSTPTDDIETEKADQERRGNEFEANRGILHGVHFFGPIEKKLMDEWEGKSPSVEEDNSMIEVEAILVGNEVIKCVANDDPLGRRPYYKASFINRPGGFWGRSLPDLIKDIQRMCNATARSLANNLAISSGPQVEIYTDRIADNGAIESIYPMKIWQLKDSPVGSASRAINFFQPTSNAGELLKVYNDFLVQADDVSGIPRIAQGNERTAGVATTAAGLSMLLENASKIIKDAIRNIDEGLIKPRIEYQFYMNLIKNKNINFTGDINIIPRGSSALTVKAAQTLRRNEFLNITANPIDQEIMGMEGRAAILMEMAKDLNLPTDVIPGPLELKKRQEQKAIQAKQAQEFELQKEQLRSQGSIQATTTQIEGQKAMAAGAQQIKIAELEDKKQQDDINNKIKIAEITQKGQEQAAKLASDSNKSRVEMETKERMQNREIALKVVKGEGI